MVPDIQIPVCGTGDLRSVSYTHLYQNKGHQIGGVGAVRLPGNGVQLFDIAVVRSDGHHVVLGQGSIHHLLQGPADVTAGIQLGGGVLGLSLIHIFV